MALNKTDMASAIINALQGINTFSSAMLNFGNAVKSYIEVNCEIMFSWAGALPSPPNTPDPVTTYDAHVQFPSFVISIPPVGSADLAMQALGIQLTVNMDSGIITPNLVPLPFVVNLTTFLTGVPIVITPSGASNQRDAMEAMCNQIITILKTKVNPVPVTGTHGPYVGSGIMISIN